MDEVRRAGEALLLKKARALALDVRREKGDKKETRTQGAQRVLSAEWDDVSQIRPVERASGQSSFE